MMKNTCGALGHTNANAGHGKVNYINLKETQSMHSLLGGVSNQSKLPTRFINLKDFKKLEYRCYA